MVTFGSRLAVNGSSRMSIEKLATPENQFQLFKRLYAAYDKVFILESLVGPRELAEMSVLGFDPEISVTCEAGKFKVADREGTIEETDVTDPLAQLRSLMPPKVRDGRFRYVGGAVGYISYDAVRFWERLPLDKRRKKKNGRSFPLIEFGIYQDGILYDHRKNQAYYFSIGKSRIQEVQQTLALATTETKRLSYSRPNRNMKKAKFEKMVRKAKLHIYNGDIFQVVLAKRMKFTVSGSLIDLYESLRHINPSPYMYLFKVHDRCIIGSSPEMLVRVTGDFVETFPIAGTRPVGKNEKEDRLLRKDLLRDEKELAEHTMLVDLARNDIGRVCYFGSVRVNELMTVKRFSHVQHIVSHVTGRLDAQYDSFDALRAVFPAGTVSGAPKVRAMQIIDELEPDLRGPYAGALGYFSFNGSCDFAITIRSLFIEKKKGFVESGAGIVMDSDPVLEWAETERKAYAMLSALKEASAK